MFVAKIVVISIAVSGMNLVVALSIMSKLNSRDGYRMTPLQMAKVRKQLINYKSEEQTLDVAIVRISRALATEE